MVQPLKNNNGHTPTPVSVEFSTIFSAKFFLSYPIDTEMKLYAIFSLHVANTYNDNCRINHAYPDHNISRRKIIKSTFYALNCTLSTE